MMVYEFWYYSIVGSRRIAKLDSSGIRHVPSPPVLWRPRRPLGLHARVNSLNLIGANLSGNVGGNDDSRMTAETYPSVPPSTAAPDTVEMVKLCGQGQHQQSPQLQNNCSDDVFCQQYYYNQEYAKMEAWLDEHPDFTHDYFIRKATRQVVDAWLVSHAAPSSLSSNSSQDIGSPTYPNANYTNTKSSSGATTPVRKISAHEFERGGLLKPIVTTIDGTPTFLSVSPTREGIASENNATHQSSAAQNRSRRRSRNELKHLDEKELIFELVKDICNELDVRSLCHKILQNVSTLLHADRSSLFLVQGDRTAVPAPDTSKCKSASIINTTTASNNNININNNNNNTCSLTNEEDDTFKTENGRIQPVGCLSMEKNAPAPVPVRNEIVMANSTAPLNIMTPNTGSVVVGSPIGSTNTGSIDLPFKSETFSTSSTHLRTPSSGSHGCHSKCLVSKLFDVCSQSTLQEMEKKKEIRIPWGMGIVGYVADSGEPVNIPDAYKDERFNHDIDARTGYKTKSLLCMPIKDCNGEVIGVAQVINKKNDGCFTTNDEKIFSSYLQFCGIGLRNAQLYEKSQLEVKRNQVLLDLARMIFEEQSTIEHMVFRILTHTQSLIQCQRVQVLLLHKASKGSFSRVFDFEANDLKGEDNDERTSPFESRFPINVGITGYVATTGETVNIPSAYEDDRFDPKVDEDAGFRHKTILCMPIKNSSGQIIGVIQLVNKFNDLPFTKNDENFVEAFAIFCGMGIHNTHMYEKAVIAMAKQSVTLELLSYHASASLDDAVRLKGMRIPSAAKLKLHDFSFDDNDLDDHDTLKACLRMFLDLDFIERFHIDYEVLCRWLLSVKKNYRNVTYHNWRHAFNVAQTMFAIITTTQWWKIFGEIECLGLMIACLCHDLDHRGTNNSFQIKASSPLAQLYSTSTMEHHHFDQCIMILNSQGNQILGNVSPDEYSRIVKVLEDAILSTDLAVYFRKRSAFFNLVKSESYQWHRDDHRELLRGMTMTVCDLAAITKPWPIEKRVAELVTTEFFEQGDIERNKFNTTPIDIMNREKEDQLPNMQVGFIDSICLPIYQAFADLSDKLEPLLEGVKKNREQWQKIAKEGTKNHIQCENDSDEN
ncbi:dual 3',5'-cyclic-AMP and -GMP phosphodiesterase 11-like isoform X2 [Planococcus citri]|uniref:dual 3',5'-cyclic-AMP and -GMP phosphodiesterase 11-like isoform X2 n=1 Tax=Planococcus citri TaxID=170843 RepID=UPI0031FA027B